MPKFFQVFTYAAVLCSAAFGQSADYPYVVKTFAGSWPLGDGGTATSALLYYPRAVAPDNAGSLYILDASNYLIRKVGPDQKISTFAKLPIRTYDMKRASDGSLYVSGESQVLKVSLAGVVSVFAGNGDYGYAGDGGLATRAQVGDAFGVAVDAAGNVFFSDVSDTGHRIREVTPDGNIKTVAGAGVNGFSGDNGPATAAAFSYPAGVAVDALGNVYVADYGNGRIRRFRPGGTITTIVGGDLFGQEVDGLAIGVRTGYIEGVAVDSAGVVYGTDTYFNVAFKAVVGGNMTILAGNFDGYSHPEDGVARSVSLRNPWGVSVDASGNVFFTDDTHRIRQLTTTGNLTTIAGKVHFAGDGAAASAALLNEPTDVALDAQSNAYITDASNYLIRKVTTDGKINTFAGKISPGVPVTGSSISNARLPYLVGEAMDANGALYLAGYYQVYKVTPDGVLTTVAGTGSSGNAGDGGKATQATFGSIEAIAVDASGRLYIVDRGQNRVRVVAPDTGVVTAFAGTGANGSSGDGQLATSARLNLTAGARIAADAAGNVYIGDPGNYSVRMVDKNGIITTVVGNGSYARADGVRATSTGFPVPGALGVDSAGNLYVASQLYPELYRVSGGILHRIAGGGSDLPTDNAAALSVFFFSNNVRIDANRDIYSADLYTSTVRKLIWNSPSGFTAMAGNGQSAAVGQTLAAPLKVQVMGRAGIGVAGVTVNFAVTSGSARLSATVTTTGADGVAGVTLTVGPDAGPVTVTATVPGTNLAAVTFAATGTPPATTCTVTQPTIASARSAGDFGGSATFASGSWLEIKGANLAATTRSWSGDDFSGANAPTSLDGVTVTINGKKAFLGYISPAQINVQAPGDSATGSVDITVATSSCSSATVQATKAAVAGGLLAPGAFNVGGTQYVVGVLSDGFFAGPAGLIPGVAFRPARPGENVTLYGIGFGDVTPATPPGVIVSAPTSIPSLSIAFGTTAATVGYAGLAPNAVGLYQFNVTVPDLADGDYALAVKVGSTTISQAASITVKH